MSLKKAKMELEVAKKAITLSSILLALTVVLVFAYMVAKTWELGKKIDLLDSQLRSYELSVSCLEIALDQKQLALDDTIKYLNECLEEGDR